MVHGVANQVNEWVANRFQQAAVQLGIATLENRGNPFAGFSFQIQKQARVGGPGITDGLHAGLHQAFLQFAGDHVETLGQIDQLCVVLASGVLQQLVAGEYQLADHIHKLVQQHYIHTYGGIALSCLLLAGVFRLCFFRRGVVARRYDMLFAGYRWFCLFGFGRLRRLLRDLRWACSSFILRAGRDQCM